MTPESILANYITGAALHPVRESVVTRVRCHLLDTLAAIVSGRFLPAGKFGYGFAEAHAKSGEATLLGSENRVSTELAAFANAMAAHADETDDSHLGGRFHPGCAIVPAALAVAEEVNAPSDALLKAIAAGYDIGARATMALGYASPRTTVFSTHSFGALFGAAAAAGALYRLNAAQALALLSFTAQQASGLSYWNRDRAHVEKSFDFGAKAARNGIFAAQLAQAGMTAPALPLTGGNGYLQAFAEEARPEVLFEELGERFEIERATIKKWPVGSPVQSVLDAIEALFSGAPAPVDAIASVTIRVPSNRFHVIDNRDMPAVCCQHLAALALSDGKVSFAASHSHQRMKAPEILAWRNKITLLPDDALTHARPERQSIVTVAMADGAVHKHHAKIVRGTPDDPMPPEEVAAKAADILSDLLPDGGRALIGTCFKTKFTAGEIVAAARLPAAKAAQLCKAASA